MKLTTSKVSAIIFTLVAVAAFAWMTMRPKVEAQAIGFGLSSNESANTATKAPAKDADSSPDNADKDSATNSDAEKKASDGANKDADPASKDTSDNASKADEDKSQSESKDQADSQDNGKQTAEESKAPVTPTSSDSTDNQAANKKKIDTGDDTSQKTSQADSVEAAGSAATIEESDKASESDHSNTANQEDNKADSVNTATTVAASAAVATAATKTVQNKQQKTAEIYTQADNARGTVVIMHGCDYKPNAEGGIVTTLHKKLPQKGWNTLSFQLPNLSNTSTFKDLDAILPEATKNIESSIATAKEKSDTPIVLLAHGCGSQIALAWMEVKGNDSIDAFIGVGTGIMNGDAKDTDHLRIPIEAMKFPQLDIFGSADHKAILKTAAERLGHINRAANPASRQKIIPDADHNMTGKEDVLAKVVAKWLEKKAFKK